MSLFCLSDVVNAWQDIEDTGRVPDLYFSMACSPCPGGMVAQKKIQTVNQLAAVAMFLHVWSIFSLFALGSGRIVAP